MSVLYTSSNKNINYLLHKFLEDKNLDLAREMIKINPKKLKGKELKSFVSLKLKYYLLTNDILNIEKIYSNKESLMKRDILNYCHYFYKMDKEKSLSSFLFLICGHNLTPDNIDFLIENNMIDFLKLLDGYYYQTSYNKNFNDISFLKSYKFNSEVIDNTIIKLGDVIDITDLKVFCEKIKTKGNKKVVLDGGNILFYYKGKVSNAGYNLMIKIIKHLKGLDIIPILILHNRHLKGKSKYITQIRNECEFIFETPYNKNDDFYILYVFLTLNCKVITKDNYKDHIFCFRSNLKEDEYNLLGKYIEELLLKYDDKICLNSDDFIHVSNCIQVFDKNILIPTLENDFYQLFF